MNLHLPRSTVAGLIVFAVVSVTLFGVLLARFGGPMLRLHQPERVRVSFADAHGVGTGDDVLVRGVRVGRVGAVARTGSRAVLTLELGDGRPPLYGDASATVASKTPLGESFVALDPGRASAGALPPGRALAGRPSVQIDEALSVLDAPARRDLRSLLATASAAESSPQAAQQVSDTLDGLDRTVAGLRAIGGTLHGQGADIAGIVQDGRAVLRELGDHDAAVRSIVSDGRTTLAALATQRPALARALALLPRIVGDTRATLAAADPLTRQALPFATDLRAAAAPLGRSLVALRPALADTRVLLGRTPALAAAALPALARLRSALPALARTSRALGPALRDVVPMLRYLAPRANTIAAWFSNTAALGQDGDAKGRWARFFVGFDPSTAVGAPGAPPGNAYTPPGDATHNRAYHPGDFPRLQPYTP